jgi:eukaryotic-like serine/threonine-protein kinase
VAVSAYDAAVREGRQEFGSYVVYEQLGVGGMASVHVAETRSAGGFRKRVALKRLLAHAAEQPSLVEAFTHEARLARYLHHSNIAQTYDFGQVDDTYFIAMELVAGPTLGQLIRQCKSTIGVIPFPITVNILTQVCDALEYAHTCVDESGTSLGIIHRDVSPPNIVISNSGLVKLIDFGLAKAKTSLVQTQVGTVKGKFRYLAPEYLSGKLDRRVDVWATGIVAHELLTTRQLFDGDNDLAILERVRSMKIEPPSRQNPDVPLELDAVVMKALERDPEKRWQSAGEMKTALADVATKLQTVVSNQQLVEWVEWAFTQEPLDERSDLSQLINLLEQPSRPSGKGPAKKRASSVVRRTEVAVGGARDDASRKRKERLFSTPQVGASIAKRKHGASRALWLLLLLAIVGGGAYAAWFYGYVELPWLQPRL